MPVIECDSCDEAVFLPADWGSAAFTCPHCGEVNELEWAEEPPTALPAAPSPAPRRRDPFEDEVVVIRVFAMIGFVVVAYFCLVCAGCVGK